MSTTPFVKAERLQQLPPYLFAEIDKKKKAALAAGRLPEGAVNAEAAHRLARVRK